MSAETWKHLFQMLSELGDVTVQNGFRVRTHLVVTSSKAFRVAYDHGH